MKKRSVIVIALLLVLNLLTGCAFFSNVNLPITNSHENESETELKDLYPAVPDELEGSYFLYGKNRGNCQAFAGKVHILAVLIDDGESLWDEETVDSLKSTMPEVIDTLTSFAKEYSAELNLTASYVKIAGDTPLDWDKDVEWRDSAIKAAGYENMETANGLICEEFDTDESVILFCFNKKGRSFAESSFDENGIEYGVIYEHDVETYIHEMLHLFGTMDYYYPNEIKAVAEKYFSGTIMASGTEPVMDSLSAFVVGWTDEISDEALAFLRESAYFTMEEAEKAIDSETFTGEVKDRVIRGYVDGKVEDVGLYTGEMVDGVANGEGTIRYYNGDFCKGQFSYGVLHGEGEYVWADGDRRSGTWVNGVLEGQGVDERANGAKYVGNFKNGKYHGEGTYVNADGNCYTGEFVNGQYHGYGKYVWADGGVYVGEFTDGDLTGYGVYTNSRGEVFDGYFENWNFVG